MMRFGVIFNFHGGGTHMYVCAGREIAGIPGCREGARHPNNRIVWVQASLAEVQTKVEANEDES